MRKLIVFLVALAISSLALSGPYRSGQDLSSKKLGWMDHGMDLVRAKLKDPSSAKFKDVYFKHNGKVPAACGKVNAKNSFGGYSGYQRFLAAGSADFTFLETDMKDFQSLWNALCG